MVLRLSPLPIDDGEVVLVACHCFLLGGEHGCTSLLLRSSVNLSLVICFICSLSGGFVVLLFNLRFPLVRHAVVEGKLLVDELLFGVDTLDSTLAYCAHLCRCDSAELHTHERLDDFASSTAHDSACRSEGGWQDAATVIVFFIGDFQYGVACHGSRQSYHDF